MKHSILIVDDEQAIRESLSLFLTGEGYNCQVAKDGHEAVEKACNSAFDIILMDLHMPHQHGIQALRDIKQCRPHSVIVIITAYYHIEEAANALKEGASQLLLKPVDFEELLEVIDKLISEKTAD